MALYRSEVNDELIIYTAKAGDCIEFNGRQYKKSYSDPAYVRMVKGKRTDGAYAVVPFFIGKTYNSVIYSYGNYSMSTRWSGSLTFEGETWYYNGSDYGFNYTSYDTVLNIGSIPKTLEYVGLLNYTSDAAIIDTNLQIAYDTLFYLKNRGLI